MLSCLYLKNIMCDIRLIPLDHVTYNDPVSVYIILFNLFMRINDVDFFLTNQYYCKIMLLKCLMMSFRMNKH